MDVSKQNIASLDEIIQKPLELLNVETGDAEFLRNLFPSSSSASSDLPFDFDADISLSASAHFSVLVGFEVTGEDLKNILFGSTTLDGAFLGSRSFIQFDDISAKCGISASVEGTMNLEGVAELVVTDGNIGFAFGLGVEEISSRIYFKDISSTLLALRKNAQWRSVGVMDIALPLSLSLPNVGKGLVLDSLVTLTDSNLFDSEPPEISLDLNLE